MPQYWFHIDWSNNGTWTNTGENVTRRVLSEAEFTYGRNQARALSPIADGSCDFELDNTSRDYSPENTSSPLNGLIMPARPIRIQGAPALLNSNPSFDHVTTGWTPFGSSTFTRSNTYSYQAAYSGRLVSDAGSDPRVEADSVVVSSNTSYQYNGFLFTPVSLPTQVHVGINWFTSGGSYLSTSMSSVTLSTNTWTEILASATSPGTAGRASIRYGFTGTPGAGSILYGANMYLTAAPTTLFRGHLDEFNVYPARGERKVQISGLDALAKLNEARANTDLYPAIRTGDAIGAVLDSIGWPAPDRDIDTGATTLRWWVAYDEDAFVAIQSIVDAEGSPALLTIDGDNKVVFRDRHHRLIRTASTTPQATFRDTGSEPKFSAPLLYDHGWRDVVNDVAFNVDERQPEPTLSDIWSSDQIYSLGASASTTVAFETEDPFYELITPVSDTDYTVQSGGVSSITLSRTKGRQCTVTITATGSGLVLSGLRVRGYSVTVARTMRASASDSTSITAYGRKQGPDNVGDASYEDAKSIASLLVASRKDRLPIVTFDLVGSNSTRLTECFNRDLSDRVTVVDAETGLNDAFFVEQMSHAVTEAGLLHTTTFGCEKVPSGSGLDDPTTVFIFDHATQGKFGTGRFAR